MTRKIRPIILVLLMTFVFGFGYAQENIDEWTIPSDEFIEVEIIKFRNKVWEYYKKGDWELFFKEVGLINYSAYYLPLKKAIAQNDGFEFTEEDKSVILLEEMEFKNDFKYFWDENSKELEIAGIDLSKSKLIDFDYYIDWEDIEDTWSNNYLELEFYDQKNIKWLVVFQIIYNFKVDKFQIVYVDELE